MSEKVQRRCGHCGQISYVADDVRECSHCNQVLEWALAANEDRVVDMMVANGYAEKTRNRKAEIKRLSAALTHLRGVCLEVAGSLEDQFHERAVLDHTADVFEESFMRLRQAVAGE